MDESEMKGGKPREIYGFKTNLRQKKFEVELRIDKVEKFNIPYAIIPSKLIMGIIYIAIIVLATIFFIGMNLKRAVYLGAPIIIIDIGIIILIILYMFIFPSFGNLLSISMNLFSHMQNSRKIRKGKQPRSKVTGFAPTRKDGLVRYAVGDVARVFLLDGKTSKTAYDDEILQQEAISARYHNTRERDTTEIIITSSQKQNTERQSESARALEVSNDISAVKDVIKQQYKLIEEKIEGEKTTFVQYLLMISPTEEILNDSIEHLLSSTDEGLYYSVKALDKAETNAILSDIKGLR